MKIAIIGAGNVGTALVAAFSRAGHTVVIGARDAAKPEIDALVAATGTTAHAPADAAAAADVVVLSLPWRVAPDAVPALGNLAGKIVIDCMNPLAMINGALGLACGFDTSGGEMVAGWLPGARVVKTLNQCGAETMERAASYPHPPVMFVAGDDAAAKATVAGLLSEIGFDPQDAGGLAMSRILEPFAFTWINQALVRGKGRSWAFAAVSPVKP